MAYNFPSNSWYSGFSLAEVFLAPINNPNGGASSGTVISNWTKCPGIVNLNLTPGGKSVDQYGDDGLVNIWVYDARASVQLETSMHVPDINAIIAPETVTQYGSGSSGSTTQYFGTDAEYTPPHFMIRAESRGKLEGPNVTATASEIVRITLFNCQLTNVLTAAETMAYGQVQNNRYTIECLPGYYDEAGVALTGVGAAGSLFALGKAEFGIKHLD